MDKFEDMGVDSMEKIKSRVDYLEKTNSWYFIALERLASLWDMDKDVKLYRDPKFLFANARKHLQQFMKFRTLAFIWWKNRTTSFCWRIVIPSRTGGS